MVKEYGLCTNPGIGYTILETDFQIGDLTRVCSPITNTDMSRIYAIEFSYKNIYHNVWVSGMESDLGPEALASVARALLVKLEAAPLSNIVTFHP